MMIDYVNFIDKLQNLKSEEELQKITQNPALIEAEQLNTINEVLNNYFISNKIKTKELVAKIANTNNKVSIERFSDFLYQICQSSLIKRKNCLIFAQKVDLDHDGFISDVDIDTFRARSNYIIEGDRKTVSQNSNKSGPAIFPKVPLPEEKVEVIIRDLRHALNQKRVSFFDFFKMIDVSKNGFVSINDFSAGVDKIAKFSQPIKDGLFAYIDKERLGIINYDDFVHVLQRSMADKPVVSQLILVDLV